MESPSYSADHLLCAFVPPASAPQVKGKAAIDVVCNPLGKSGGALIQQFLIFAFGSLANSTPYLGIILLVIVLAWLAAARSLDEQFTPLAQEDLKGKLAAGKLSVLSSALLGRSKAARKEVRPVCFYWREDKAKLGGICRV